MFEQDYRDAFSKVTVSEDTYRRILDMTTEKRKNRKSGFVLSVAIVAVMISLLAVTVSASEVVRNWLAGYFGSEKGSPLSQEQVAFLEENEQHPDESKIVNGWTMELRSTLTDGMKGYIVLGITAPEGTNLEEIPARSQKEYYGPGNDYLLKSEDAVLHCGAYPDFGGVLGTIRASWTEDGDGQTNTLNYIIDVAPDAEWAAKDPFGPDTVWSIHIQDLVSGFPDQTILAKGTWDFEFTFEYDKTEIQLLQEPMKVRAWALPGNGTEVETEVTVTSMALRPFGITLYYGDESDGLDYSRTSVNVTVSDSGNHAWYIVMDDGSRIELIRCSTNPVDRHVILESTEPIVLEKADHLLLNDGTILKIP